MHWVAWFCLGAAAVAYVIRELILRPPGRKERLAWWLSLLALSLLAVATLLGFPRKEASKAEKQEMAKLGAKEANQELNCTIDSLMQANARLEKENQSLRRRLASCFAQHAVTESELAQVAMGFGQYDSALYHLNKALVAVKGDHNQIASLFFYIGNCYYLKGLQDSALASYDSTLAYKRDYPEAWYNRGDALAALGRYGEALASCDSALAYRRDFPEAWSNRGSALGALGRYQEAFASFDSALAYKRDDPGAWYNRGVALCVLGRYGEAVASYDSTLTYKWDYPAAWSNRGNALLALGRHGEALASYDSALAYKRTFPEAWYNRGNALAKLRWFEEALQSCDSALKYDPTSSGTKELRETIQQELER